MVKYSGTCKYVKGGSMSTTTKRKERKVDRHDETEFAVECSYIT